MLSLKAFKDIQSKYLGGHANFLCHLFCILKGPNRYQIKKRDKAWTIQQLG